MTNRRQRVEAPEPRRPSMVTGEVKPGKEGAQQWVDAGGLGAYSGPTKAAAQRLLHDARVASYWGLRLGACEFEEAVHCYELATGRDAWAAWDRKTQRERTAWNRQFDKLVSRLIELMSEGPTPPEVWGFPARDYVLMEVLRRVGHPLPSTGDSEAFFRKMLSFNAAVEGLPWTTSDVLLDYQKQVEIDSTNALVMLKKPRDAKAERAKFIANFRRNSGCSAPVVAAVAGVMFDDDAIDERLVRRLTSGRADF